MALIVSILYMMIYLVSGFVIANWFFSKEKELTRFIMGAVFGLFMLMWLPALVSFAIGFNAASQLIALVICVAGGVFVLIKFKRPKLSFSSFKKEIIFAAVIIPLAAVTLYILHTHSLRPDEFGNLRVGQSTYGDLNFHAGLMTSISEQGVFPPYYSIAAGKHLVGYPFLCDSVSSTFLSLGANLRLAYMLPMVLGIIVLFSAVFMFFRTWLKSDWKAAFATVLFLVGGGFGFVYFFDLVKTDGNILPKLLNAFYVTPTNMRGGSDIHKNIHIVTVIADMIIPQRSTLFGWSMMIPGLWMLIKAVFEKGNEKYFIPLGIIAGGLPLIHTHSFLCLAVISAVCFIYKLCQKFSTTKEHEVWKGAIFALVGLFAYICGKTALFEKLNINLMLKGLGMGLFIGGLIYVVIALINYKFGKEEQIKEPVSNKSISMFVLYGAIAAVLAIPILLKFTMHQASGDGFLRAYFNWENRDDNYFWFYIKNVGLMFVMMIPAFFCADAKKKWMFAGGLGGLLLAETIVFQPLVYDNNKLVFAWIFLLCGLFADFCGNILKMMLSAAMKNVLLPKKIANTAGVCFAAAIVIAVCNVSGVMTISREVVSDYQLFSKEAVEATDFIRKETPKDALFLTASNHNNAVASLSGRNVLCSGKGFLSTHGLDYHDLERAEKELMTNPTKELLEEYNISYVYIGDAERGEFSELNQQFYEDNFSPPVFETEKDGHNKVYIYDVRR